MTEVEARVTVASRLKALLDWCAHNALATPPRPGQQPAAVHHWPGDADERRASSQLYPSGRSVMAAPQKRPRAVSPAGARDIEGEFDGCRT